MAGREAVHTLLQLALGVALGSGCGQPEHSTTVTSANLHHRVIDPRPNSGTDCCTDVLAIGDVNGDGRLDVVLGGQGATEAGLVWYESPDWVKHPVAHGEFTTDGAAADVDGDGDVDLVVGTHAAGKGEVLWFENLDGRGGKWRRHAVGAAYAHDLVVGDVNGDARVDVVTCDKRELTLWRQTMDGGFQRASLLQWRGEGTALADIDRDGDLDVVFGASWLENPWPLPTQPWRSRQIAAAWPADTRVAVADMNGDGRFDVVLSVSEGEGHLAWFEAPGDPRSGSWVGHPIETGRLEGSHSLQVADLDGDGALDVIAAEMHTSREKRVLVYFNRGGTFAPIVVSRRGSHNLRVADLDGDGDIDIVGKNYAGAERPLELWENLVSQPGKPDHGGPRPR
jgi:hypothetical protein